MSKTARSRWSARSVLNESILLGWLMADQGIFALTSFITNILFARWLLPVDYGMFAISFSGYLLLTVLHYGLVLEPLLIQSAKVGGNRVRTYILTLIKMHGILIGGISALAVVGFWIARALGESNVALAILGAGICGSIMCTLLTARRLCLVFLSAHVSAAVGILYMIGVISTTYLMHEFIYVTWFDIWLIMGVWSFLCSLAIFILLYVSLQGNHPYDLAELIGIQWHYARYGLVASVCSWIRADGAFLILANIVGLELTAQTRAMIILCNPLLQISIALQSSWLVAFSRDNSKKKLWKTSAIFGTGVALVVIVATQSSDKLVILIYSGRYLEGAWMIPWYCLGIGLLGLEAVFTSYLKAGGLLRRGFAPQIVGSVVSVAIAIVLIPRLSEAGFLIAILGTFGVGTIMALVSAILPRRVVISEVGAR